MASCRVNITLTPELLAKAKELNINVSQAAREGVIQAIRKEQEVRDLLK